MPVRIPFAKVIYKWHDGNLRIVFRERLCSPEDKPNEDRDLVELDV